MWNDPIVEDVRKVRDAYAKRFGYDLKRIFEDLRKRESKRIANVPESSEGGRKKRSAKSAKRAKEQNPRQKRSAA